MKKTRWLVIAFAAIIVLSNIGGCHTAFKFFLDENHYKYSSGDGLFTFTEFKQHDVAMRDIRFNRYKSQTGNNSAQLYRLFSKNPFAFWRWTDYINDDRYRLPYRSWKEIERKRGPRDQRTGLQDF